MTICTLIFAADQDGRMTDPATGKCWDVDRAWFREQIKGQSIICGRKTFEKDWRGLTEAKLITVITRQNCLIDIIDGLAGEQKALCPYISPAGSILTAMSSAQNSWIADNSKKDADEIFCIGGRETIEAFAPFASRLLITAIGAAKDDIPWLPRFLEGCLGLIYTDEDGEAAEPLWEPSTTAGDGFTRFDIRRFQPIKF